MTNRKVAYSMFLGLAGAAVVACSAASSPDDGAVDVTEAELGASGVEACDASSYLVIDLGLNGQAPRCPSVPGHGGAWKYTGPKTVPTCVPTTAPASSAPFACAYTWAPDASTPKARADVTALDAIPGVFVGAVGAGGGAEGTCADSSALPYVALMDQAGVRCQGLNGGGGPNGPRECDVCGATVYPGVTQSNLWLPAWSDLRTIILSLSNGSQHVLALGASTTKGAATKQTHGALIKIALPKLPHGVSYVEGPALGYGYKSH